MVCALRPCAKWRKKLCHFGMLRVLYIQHTVGRYNLYVYCRRSWRINQQDSVRLFSQYNWVQEDGENVNKRDNFIDMCLLNAFKSQSGFSFYGYVIMLCIVACFVFPWYSRLRFIPYFQKWFLHDLIPTRTYHESTTSIFHLQDCGWCCFVSQMFPWGR